MLLYRASLDLSAAARRLVADLIHRHRIALAPSAAATPGTAGAPALQRNLHPSAGSMGTVRPKLPRP
jgi:hypothetical protein